ncbi:hypothetical protein [Pseudoalteromonas aurantia]|uniref:Uncharacterized protein n=1 Tax=Pseudoalteromonas aurantia TaxID=43654 RepID=A0A5S3V7C8_9GAMM|nr:hypothetical protein [Pseudoalteromonas aurantia]TMO67256.1 hypothetical protein CWC18_00980 [Pseudoalteromonas aurantia]TMO67430.1 hypothetical protein CWC19_13830 [Pseudoalteromonas aurantia]TMO70881.1 hypothetical protein CWC20_19070 [Pseudoalteromonas aurantia]
MIKANQQGEVTGRFTIPSNIPAGRKRVEFTGAGKSNGSAVYTGSGTIRVETMRQVNTLITQRYDPLAQTFTLEQNRFIAAVDLWFKAKGPEAVQVQIREVVQGVPTQNVLAQTSVDSADIHLGEQFTRFSFTPVYLLAGQEYAIVVLTDGAEHEVAISELGQFDAQTGWVTSQPYQVGVLLSSSNASTWTPHQTRDLTFRLKAAKFTNTTQTLDLGSVSAEQITDVMALAVVQRPSANTDVEFTISSNDSAFSTQTLQEWQPAQLPAAFTGQLSVKAHLRGSQTLSPILFADSQCAKGVVTPSADYISRAINCRRGGQFTVSFEANLPTNATVNVFVEKQTESGLSWAKLEVDAVQELADSWQQIDCRLTNIEQDSIRVKLVLTGTASSRPRVRNLRAFST